MMMFVIDSYQEGSDSVKLLDIQTFVDIRGNLTLIRKQTRTILDIMGFITAIHKVDGSLPALCHDVNSCELDCHQPVV